MTLMQMVQIEKKRRAPKEGLAYYRGARGLVADTQQSLAEWHREIAHMRAAQTIRATDGAALRERAKSLFPIVTAARIELEERLETADAHAAAHSLVRDVRKALHHLELELQSLSIGAS